MMSEHDKITAEMRLTQERFFVFIAKLEDKLKEFTEAAVPELAASGNDNTDDQTMAFYRMKSAVLGQIDGIRKKADEIREEKIIRFYYPSDNHELRTAYHNFRDACFERVRQFEELYSECRHNIENAYVENYEAEYQKILAQYEEVRNKFTCTQCGGPITIDKLYSVTTYLTCPSCLTRNTFDPGTRAKTLEHIGRSLAEQRTHHLLEAHGMAAQEAHVLFQRTHRLKLDLAFEREKGKVQEQTALLRESEQGLKQALVHRDALYQKYLRAMFDEWNAIHPALSAQHEAFYKTLWEDYLHRNPHDMP